jgi:hypothetical protein
MTTYARIAAGVVAELADIPGDPADFFHPDLVWVPAPAGCDVGWVQNGGQLQAPPADMAVLKLDKVQAIEAAAMARVDAGATWSGHIVQIDEASRQNISAVAVRAGFVALHVPGMTWAADFAWRMSDNSWVPITAAQFLDLGQAAADLYTAIVVRRANLKDSVTAAADVAALNAIDPSAGWPA